MRTYEERGVFQNEEYARQLVSFTGMNFAGRSGECNVTPTDIDGAIQLNNENCIILFELKHSGGIPSGQKIALMNMCDAIQRGGTDCIVLLAEHNTPCGHDIIAKDAAVKEAYMNGVWITEILGRTLKEVIDAYIGYIKR